MLGKSAAGRIRLPSRTRDPGANIALVLGLLSLVVGVLGPFAMAAGFRSLDRIASAGGTLTGRGAAVAGLLGGAIATFFMLAGLAAFCAAQLP